MIQKRIHFAAVVKTKLMGTEEFNLGYALSNQQYGSINFSASGSNGSYHSPSKSSSIDDLLPDQNNSAMPKITDGFYSQLGEASYAPNLGDFGAGDYTRMQMGYGVNSRTDRQYGFK